MHTLPVSLRPFSVASALAGVFITAQTTSRSYQLAAAEEMIVMKEEGFRLATAEDKQQTSGHPLSERISCVNSPEAGKVQKHGLALGLHQANN